MSVSSVAPTTSASVWSADAGTPREPPPRLCCALTFFVKSCGCRSLPTRTPGRTTCTGHQHLGLDPLSYAPLRNFSPRHRSPPPSHSFSLSHSVPAAQRTAPHHRPRQRARAFAIGDRRAWTLPGSRAWTTLTRQRCPRGRVGTRHATRRKSATWMHLGRELHRRHAHRQVR